MAARTIIAFLFVFAASPCGFCDSDLMDRVEKKLDSINSFSADFTQSYSVDALDTVIIESGRISVLKPGRMRWDYNSPDKKLFLCDGEKVYFYIPEDKQVVIGEISELKEQTSVVSMLTERSELSGNYTCEIIKEEEGEYLLRFQPVVNNEKHRMFLMNTTVDGLIIKRIAYIDNGGNLNEIRLENMEINKNIKEKLFKFNMPKGVDVITGDTPTDIP